MANVSLEVDDTEESRISLQSRKLHDARGLNHVEAMPAIAWRIFCAPGAIVI